jgi:hypothetical protein
MFEVAFFKGRYPVGHLQPKPLRESILSGKHFEPARKVTMCASSKPGASSESAPIFFDEVISLDNGE